MNIKKRQQLRHTKVIKKSKIFWEAIKNLTKLAKKILKWSWSWVNNHLRNSIKHAHKERFQNNWANFTMKKIPSKLKKLLIQRKGKRQHRNSTKQTEFLIWYKMSAKRKQINKNPKISKEDIEWNTDNSW